MPKLTKEARLAVALLVLAGCKSKPAEETPAAQAGDLRVTVRIEPDPPVAGENVLHLEVRDPKGAAVEGARIGFAYDMPAMGSMPEMKGGGETKPLGQGRYDVGYSLSMQGDWALTLSIEAAGHPPAELRLKVSPPRKGYTTEQRASTPDQGGPQSIDVSPKRQQLIGVVYAKVARRPLSLSLRAAGLVEVDETQLRDVVLKYDAFVEKLFVDQAGQPVKAGQPLLTLYSPELLASERDYLTAVKSTGLPGSEQLLRAAHERLQSWGLSAGQLADLRKGGTAEPRVTIRSPVDGTVLEKLVVAGTRVMSGATLYRIGDLGHIWVQAELFESDAPYLQPGLPATMTAPGVNGPGWKGQVQFVYPTIDEKTRSVRARLAFSNSRQQLKPGMFVDVRVEVPLGQRLAVPDDALLASGEHRYAFVKRGEGQLTATEVVVGARAGELDEVLSGLHEGDEVATQATFLLSSEAQLRNALPRWSSP